MDNSIISLVNEIDFSSMILFVGWSILNKSNFPRKIFFKRHGNESGQYKNIPPHTSVTLPDDKNYQFWDVDTQMSIMPRRQVIINDDGYYE